MTDRAGGRSLYLYAVALNPAEPQHITGVGGRPVRLLRIDNLGLACGDVVRADLDARPRDDLAQTHDGAVRAVAGVSASVLPFRPGVVVADENTAAAFLRERAGQLRAALQKVAGHDEWAVMITRTDPDAAQPQRRATAGLAAAVDDRLRAMAGGVATGRVAPEAVLSRAYLVPRASEQRFVAEADACGDRLAGAGLGLRISGPWPAYSFAGPRGPAGGVARAHTTTTETLEVSSE